VKTKITFKNRLETYGGISALASLLTELSIPADNLSIGIDTEGRPMIKGYTERPLDFNISHSGDYAVCAVATGENARVGIDIEYQSYEKEHRGKLVKRFFFPKEIKNYFDNGESTETFLRIWTQKEAVMKYKGSDIHNQTLCVNTALLGETDFEMDEFSIFEDLRDYSKLPVNATDEQIAQFKKSFPEDRQYVITVCYPKGSQPDFTQIY